MRAVVCFGSLAVISLTCAEVLAEHADSQEAREARARAALALAAAAQAEAPATPAAPRCGCGECDGDCKSQGGCVTCLTCARKEAAGRKPLALWVGGETCEGHGDVRAALPGHVHAHLKAFNGDASPRLLVECGPAAGEFWRFDKDRIDAATVRRAVNPPPSPAPAPRPVPLSYTPPSVPFGACRT